MNKYKAQRELSLRERSAESSGLGGTRLFTPSGWLGALWPGRDWRLDRSALRWFARANRRRFERSLVFLILCLGLLVYLPSPPAFSAGEVREPQVAGGFYPADPQELDRMIKAFLSNVRDSPRVDEEIGAVIVPHAGYVYSGQVAAYAYKQIIDRDIDTVILLGPFHRALFEGASVWQSGTWETPLGKVEVDFELASAILKQNEKLKFIPQAHLGEHSIEVQIPFLQEVLKNFKIVPIAVSDDSPENCRLLASAILNAIQGKKVLIVVSTDMSHYHPEEKAQIMDRLVLDRLGEKNANGLFDDLAGHKGELCGSAGVLTLLEMANRMGGMELQVLKYATSGDVTGDKKAVVGYGASILYRKPTGENTDMLNPEQQKELLKVARQTIETYLATGKMPEIQTADSFLKEKRAAFVTLREHGELRGCIGSTVATEPLYLAVRNMAVESAIHDPRFMPVRKDGVKNLTIEISVLSLPQRVKSADEIIIGKHGVIVSKGGRSGLFLPKVADETGWSKEKFLSELCYQKADLSPDAWKDPSTALFVFTAQEFGEKENS